jgi:Protein of unknown function (DUF1616)
MRLKHLDLIVTITLAVMNVIWAMLPSRIPIIGIVLALPLVFILPGYALTGVLFRKRSLNSSNRLLFSIGLSLAIDILSGLILNLLPGGLQAISWALWLGLFTVVFSLLAAYLRREAPVNETHPVRFRFTLYPWMIFALATLVAIFSILYSAFGAVKQPYPGFTQLWMLPQAQAGKSCAITLGVRSFESTSVTYRITMTVMGAQVTSWPSVLLAPQQEWNRVVPVTPTAAHNVYVEVQLYRLDKPQNIYREVHSTLHNCPISQTTSPYPILASAYKGTFSDISANLTTNMSLTEVQQSGGNINGYLTIHTLPQRGGPFKGMVTAAKHIQFTVIDETGHTTLSFDGDMQPGGTISGSYCTIDRKGQCSSGSGYGLWSVGPASS